MPSFAKIANQNSILRVRLVSNNSGYKFLLQIVFSLIYELGDHLLFRPSWIITVFASLVAVGADARE